MRFISLIKRTVLELENLAVCAKLSNEIVLMIAITVMSAENYCPCPEKREAGGGRGLAVYWL